MNLPFSYPRRRFLSRYRAPGRTPGLVCGCLLLLASVAHADTLTETQTHLRRLLTQFEPLRIAEIDIRARRLIRRVYAARNYLPMWSETTRLALIAAALSSTEDGLQPRDYPQPTLTITATSPPVARAAQEILLTESLTRLAYSLRFGKANPRALDPHWNYARALGATDPVAWLTKVITNGDLAVALAALRPSGPYYGGLRSALAAYRLAETAPWPTLSAGPTLKPGQSAPRIAELRARLIASGDLRATPALDALRYDDALVVAVQAFQARHGLTIDGAVGKATRNALNVSRAVRIDTLRVNLERVRWIFHDLRDEFVAVNIAAFHAAYVKDGQTRWHARVVVGRPYRQTPIFTSQITYLELNPTWTVPPTILAEDILPAVRHNLSYLAHKKLQVLDRDGRVLDPHGINWSHLPAENFPYVLRQPPGDDNALGRIKFMFPNPHAVYLHDTPARELFAASARSFSSGCVRLERPFALAEILLRDNPAWTPSNLATAVATGKSQRINLSRPVTIMLLYLTAFPDDTGDTQFREDIYARDAAVRKGLDAPFEFAAPGDYREEAVKGQVLLQKASN
jgi:L,D-transpeptidase YcbB